MIYPETREEFLEMIRERMKEEEKKIFEWEDEEGKKWKCEAKKTWKDGLPFKFSYEILRSERGYFDVPTESIPSPIWHELLSWLFTPPQAVEEKIQEKEILPEHVIFEGIGESMNVYIYPLGKKEEAWRDLFFLLLPEREIWVFAAMWGKNVRKDFFVLTEEENEKEKEEISAYLLDRDAVYFLYREIVSGELWNEKRR